MPCVFVTLVGGSPWGFRIQGGRGTGQPLRLSKINPGSKASVQDLREGDLLKMVNGYLTDGLSQMDVQNIIKNTGMHLLLEVERKPLASDRRGIFTARKALTFNGTPSYGKENDKNGEYLSHSPVTAIPYQCNGNYNINSNLKGRSSSLPNGNIENGLIKKDHTISTNSIVTDAPPPHGAILLEKKITIEGDKVHTDKYYAIPVKEILKEKTTTTKYIAAPPKYDGIGPTEDGVPTGLRQSVKKENMHNWYKTMFKSLHKSDSSNDPQEYIVGYSSEPETNSREKAVRKKSSTLDHRSGRSNANHLQGYPASARSSIETYKVRPRLIEDYEPGHSSVTDDEITIGWKRFLPALNVPKTSYEYKNGYDQENRLRRNLSPSPPSPEQQKMWYKDIQKGGEVPQFGLGKNAPEKYRDPVIGPLPPPPMNYSGPRTPQQATRPLSLPKDYINYNNNNFCQQSNGVYEIQMRQAIHDELHHRLSPASSALSSPSRSLIKSPSKSPDLKLPARVLFDFNAESSKEVSLKKGEMVLILRQLDKNWYEGEHNGYIGIFPISYVEIIPPEHTSTPIKTNSEGVGRVLYDFIAHTSLELSARKGDAVNLLRRVDTNWYEVRVNNRKGIIPASYLQILEEPYERSIASPTLKSCLKSSSRSSSETRDVSKANSLSPYSMNSSPTPIFENGQNKIKARSKKGSGLIEPVMYKAIYSYVPQNTDELEILEGDTVYVVEMCDDGWYVGTSVRTGQFGIFPGNYVDKA